MSARDEYKRLTKVKDNFTLPREYLNEEVKSSYPIDRTFYGQPDEDESGGEIMNYFSESY